MTKTFNLKQYQGKNRLYTRILKNQRISRLWVWDELSCEYTLPPNGKVYVAYRYESDPNGKRVRRYKFFGSLEEVRRWQASEVEHVPIESVAKNSEESFGRLFREIVEEWKKRTFPRLALSTKGQYENMLRLHFSSLLECPIRKMTPSRIDQWLDELKDPSSRSMQQGMRKGFRHELSLLSTILRYYDEYGDDRAFVFPVKQERHRESVKVRRASAPKPKDLPEEEFLRFRDQLKKRESGKMFYALATLQYYQATRISEAAGVYYEDLRFDWINPSNSRINFVRSVCWPRQKEIAPFVQDGFKNEEANEGVKEHPMFPQTFEALSEMCRRGGKGLVFHENGNPITYRRIQRAYDSAFKEAGLPYTGTHVLRHGGCRRVYNATKGDVRIAQQILGNTSTSSTEVYAKAYQNALAEEVSREWGEYEKKSEMPTPCGLGMTQVRGKIDCSEVDCN